MTQFPIPWKWEELCRRRGGAVVLRVPASQQGKVIEEGTLRLGGACNCRWRGWDSHSQRSLRYLHARQQWDSDTGSPFPAVLFPKPGR
jgi:hypothetical protein